MNGVSAADDVSVKLVNNSFAFLVQDIRYKLADFEVDRAKKVGITSAIETMQSINKQDVDAIKTLDGWHRWVTSWDREEKTENSSFACHWEYWWDSPKTTRIILNVEQELFLTCTGVNAKVRRLMRILNWHVSGFTDDQ